MLIIRCGFFGSNSQMFFANENPWKCAMMASFLTTVTYSGLSSNGWNYLGNYVL